MWPARIDRRQILALPAILFASRMWKPVTRARARPDEPSARSNADEPRARPSADEIEEIVRWVVTTPRDPALKRGARELHDGLDPARLLGAILVASARDIRTDLPVFNHAALSVSAIDQLTASTSAAERQHAVLWCLDYFKESQETEARTDDWRMAPVEMAKLPTGAKARAALVDALERWDREAADVAITGWVRSAPLDEVYALVWEYGLRCVANIGHKGIYAALSRRALPIAGERFAEDVLRSVVSSFFLDGRTSRAAPFERSRKLVTTAIVARAQRPASEVGPARELLAAIRQSTPEELPSVVAKLIADGAAPSGLWDAVVAAACEVTVASPGAASLHAFTSTNSLHYIALHAPSERVAQLALLQSAAWAAQFRAGLHEEEAAMRIDGVEATRSTMDALFLDDPESASRVSGALWLGAHESDAFLERAHRVARTKSDDVHEFKLAAAALEEARVVSAWVRPFVCAALAVHLPAQDRMDGVKLQRIGDAIAVASAR